jgi:hypothetical protein
VSTKYVWKTPLFDVEQEARIGRILHVGYDPKLPDAAAVVWHESGPTEPRILRVVGTGTEIPEGFTHRGSAVRADGFVFHVYELGVSR